MGAPTTENTRTRFSVELPSSVALFVFVSPGQPGRTAANSYDFASVPPVAGDDPVNESDPSGDGPCGPSKAPTATVGNWYRPPTYTLYCGTAGSSGYGYRHIVSGGHFGGDVNGFVRNYFIGGTLETGTLVERGRNLVYREGFKFLAADVPLINFHVNVVVKNTRNSVTTAYITTEIYDQDYTYSPAGATPKVGAATVGYETAVDPGTGCGSDGAGSWVMYSDDGVAV